MRIVALEGVHDAHEHARDERQDEEAFKHECRGMLPRAIPVPAALTMALRMRPHTM
jgi:hypothetical protein